MHEWANLGQGAPEAGDVEGCFKRPETLHINPDAREYGPTAGIKPLREAIAHLYNEHHRQGKESKYTFENVCVVPGGRAGLIRIAAVLGNAYLGFFVPDYTGKCRALRTLMHVETCCEELTVRLSLQRDVVSIQEFRCTPNSSLRQRQLPHSP